MAKGGEAVKTENTLGCACILRLCRIMAKENERLRMSQMAEGVRFELTREQSPLPVFKTGALNHSATLP